MRTIKLPFFIIENMPLLKQFRAPSRFILLAYFSTAIFSGFAYDNIFNRVNMAVWSRRLIALIIVFIALFDFWPGHMKIDPVKIPKFYEEIKNNNDEFAVLNIPVDRFDANKRYMYYQTFLNKYICGGHISRPNPHHYINLKKMNYEKDDLKKANIKYIIVHEAFLSEDNYFNFKNIFSFRFQQIGEQYGQCGFRVY